VTDKDHDTRCKGREIPCPPVGAKAETGHHGHASPVLAQNPSGEVERATDEDTRARLLGHDPLHRRQRACGDLRLHADATRRLCRRFGGQGVGLAGDRQRREADRLVRQRAQIAGHVLGVHHPADQVRGPGRQAGEMADKAKDAMEEAAGSAMDQADQAMDEAEDAADEAEDVADETMN